MPMGCPAGYRLIRVGITACIEQQKAPCSWKEAERHEPSLTHINRAGTLLLTALWSSQGRAACAHKKPYPSAGPSCLETPQKHHWCQLVPTPCSQIQQQHSVLHRDFSTFLLCCEEIPKHPALQEETWGCPTGALPAQLHLVAPKPSGTACHKEELCRSSSPWSRAEQSIPLPPIASTELQLWKHSAASEITAI